MVKRHSFPHIFIPIKLCISAQLYHKVSLKYVKTNLYFWCLNLVGDLRPVVFAPELLCTNPYKINE